MIRPIDPGQDAPLDPHRLFMPPAEPSAKRHDLALTGQSHIEHRGVTKTSPQGAGLGRITTAQNDDARSPSDPLRTAHLARVSRRSAND